MSVQVVTVAATPVLTRLYGPEEFATLALLLAFSLPLAAAANGRYDLAVLVPSDDEIAIRLVKVGCLIAVSVVVLTLAPTAWISVGKGGSESLRSMGQLIWAFPMIVLLGSVLPMMTTLANRDRRYKAMSVASVTRVGVTTGTQIALGATHVGALGLIAGTISGLTVGIFILTNSVAGQIRAQADTFNRLLQTARRYSRFPSYYVPASFLNSDALTVICVSWLYGDEVLGQFVIAFRVISIPGLVMSAAVAAVFARDLSEHREDRESTLRLFNRMLIGLATLGGLMALLTIALAPRLLPLILGSEWLESGFYARALAPMLAMSLVVTAFPAITQIFERQGIALLIQTGFFSLPLIGFALAQGFDMPAVSFMWLISIAYFIYGLMVLWTYRRLLVRGGSGA